MNIIVVSEYDFVYRLNTRSIDKTLEWVNELPGKRSIFQMERGFKLPATITSLESIYEKIEENRVDDIVNNHYI